MEKFEQELRGQEIKEQGLINAISDYAIKNKMTMQEIDKCISKVKEVYYTDAIIRGYEEPNTKFQLTRIK